MNNINFPSIRQSTLDLIICLSERREHAEYAHFPDGISSGKAKLPPSSQAHHALKAAIESLTLTETEELHALMYLGIGGIEDETVLDAISWQREQAAGQSEAQMKISLYGKVPLAGYLREGIRLTKFIT